MNRKTLGQAALVSLALGVATIACTPDGGRSHVASASDTAATGRLAARTRAALAKKDGPQAVRLAEALVARQPNDADHRMLLGQAYLADGRFASAATAFADTLGLAPDQPRAAFDLALADIARGRADAARTRIASLDGRLPDSDLGLAQALAGDRDGAIARLTGIVRAGKSDARARQNLALAFALAGRWGEARGMAMQDTPPDRIDGQLAGWATLAQAGPGAAQVAAMLGVTPAIGDPGQPTRLALAAPNAAQPVALALTETPPPAAPVPAAPSDVAAVSPPAVAVAAVPPAPAVPAPPAAVPLLLAPTPPELVRVALAAPAPARTVVPGRIATPREDGGFVVQLGAYARAGAIETAWVEASRLSPRVATFSPVRGATRLRDAALVRLSVTGFETRAAATALCFQVKARGGDCFVRVAAGDAPLQWVRRETRMQVAMR